MIESTVHLPVGLAMLQDIFHAPTGDQLPRIFLRWAHFVAGITWIGMLYFFNLVNVNFMKALDGPTKKIVIPNLMPKALWYFRWGAVVTVLAGLTYYAMFILSTDVNNANNLGRANANVWVILLVWLLIAGITFAIEFLIIKKTGLTKDGRVLAVVIAILLILMAIAIVWWLNMSLMSANGRDFYASNKTFSIGIGGAMGLIMLLNVWGIIWPAQKRIIAGTVSGDAAPPELARQAFLASRTNAWMSLPMLLFMGTSHGDWIMLGK
jgi:uncharacterized membrane protein